VKQPADDLWLEQFQFVQLAIQRAIATGRPFDQCKVIEHARIDWQRKQKAEKRRQRRTKRIDDLIEEPSIPSFLDTVAAAEEVLRMVNSLQGRQHDVVRMLLLEELSREEVAQALGVDPETVSKTRTRAIRTLRKGARKDF